MLTEAIAIDFGLASEIGTKHAEKHIQVVLFSSSFPLLTNSATTYLVNNLQVLLGIAGLDATRQELIEVANEIA